MKRALTAEIIRQNRSYQTELPLRGGLIEKGYYGKAAELVMHIRKIRLGVA
jgi:hypothetical protein